MDDGSAANAIKRGLTPKAPNRVWKRFLELCDEHGAKAIPGDPTSVPGLCAAWLEINPSPHYDYCLNDFITFAYGAPLSRIPADFLHRYHGYLKGKKTIKGKKIFRNGPQTIRHKLGAAIRVLKYGQKIGLLEKLPDLPVMPKIVNQPKDVPLDELVSIFEKLKDSRRKRASLIFHFILATGCRPGEACQLDWDDVDLRDRKCIIRRHKTAHHGKNRTIYLNPAAIGVLEETATLGPREGPVFKSRNGNAYKVNGLRSILTRLGAKPYSLRHTFAQNVLDQGGSVDDLRKLLGHAPDSTITKRYAEIRDARIQAVSEALVSPLQRAIQLQPSSTQDQDSPPPASHKNPEPNEYEHASSRKARRA